VRKSWEAGLQQREGKRLRLACHTPAKRTANSVASEPMTPGVPEEFGGGSNSNAISPVLWFSFRFCAVTRTEADAGGAALKRYAGSGRCWFQTPCAPPERAASP
jgi:hypothetical protein